MILGIVVAMLIAVIVFELEYPLLKFMPLLMQKLLLLLEFVLALAMAVVIFIFAALANRLVVTRCCCCLAGLLFLAVLLAAFKEPAAAWLLLVEREVNFMFLALWHWHCFKQQFFVTKQFLNKFL